ncbi:MAG: iron-sulfur cluster insertion protein ErpA [Planctomycetota bacterium]|nr:MAG: iron-sulfur cluster insertion protein ErpA [Planctomycetota bacterium]
MQITITEKAIRKVHQFMADDASNQGKALRVYVEGGGCAGFQYGLAFDDPRETDEVIPSEGFDIVVDPMSQTYLDGCSIDFVDGLYGSGFKIHNPNATGTCGCGHSFTV